MQMVASDPHPAGKHHYLACPACLKQHDHHVQAQIISTAPRIDCCYTWLTHRHMQRPLPPAAVICSLQMGFTQDRVHSRSCAACTHTIIPCLAWPHQRTSQETTTTRHKHRPPPQPCTLTAATSDIFDMHTQRPLTAAATIRSPQLVVTQAQVHARSCAACSRIIISCLAWPHQRTSPIIWPPCSSKRRWHRSPARQVADKIFHRHKQRLHAHAAGIHNVQFL